MIDTHLVFGYAGIRRHSESIHAHRAAPDTGGREGVVVGGEAPCAGACSLAAAVEPAAPAAPAAGGDGRRATQRGRTRPRPPTRQSLTACQNSGTGRKAMYGGCHLDAQIAPGMNRFSQLLSP